MTVKETGVSRETGCDNYQLEVPVLIGDAGCCILETQITMWFNVVVVQCGYIIFLSFFYIEMFNV